MGVFTRVCVCVCVSCVCLCVLGHLGWARVCVYVFAFVMWVYPILWDWGTIQPPMSEQNVV